MLRLTVKTATVRDLRNDFARVAVWIGNGEEVTVTRAGKPFARLSPWTHPGKATPRSGWPDLAARRRRILPAGLRGIALSEVVSGQRGEQ